MEIFKLLEGKKMKVMTDMNVEVELVIKSVEERRHSRQITPDTRENDWWGKSEHWSTYIVNFTNGSNKEFRDLREVQII